ncbi:MAG: tRNA uridine-5-carboxymethylaminomethyl(34) synthesis GTPase MnmE [Deltaproteobacteria bacterium]|nr:tRNA uridine-5-carboxymethylaminomethyl(34) synthesis GTPase MnmE [Deltaproteobacteria bacterium]MBW1951508.1 tRNA uridine-5-carboxymethylaminomethyl(34) synthesis GTPase MnmE [Deltaproteobacteria bacterium]MBW1987427.1 tRNA uridine-5-carboxymethylaminomethyl(34) synthesis GTPase MnmE [Deltaproteobacteria bacterium]MBW2135497.1 tRNA uridine-5-carboxymethylaminomethyl(34) synthesis GTPase MnmE [Deltaproteobacteria bacterium]
MSSTHDTIVAISTPLGEAGIGIVRLSGPQAHTIAQKLFRPYQVKTASFNSHHLVLGQIIDPTQGEAVDEVLLSLMRAPHSYTREDVIEINCHSGYGVLSRILQLTLEQGARLAAPGEFTQRAFLSGRIDLTQAEAVLEVIQARTAASLRLAARHLSGSLGGKIRELRDRLTEVLARVEAAIDFSEDTPELSPSAVLAELEQLATQLQTLQASYAQGRLYREGLDVVIVGRPNVGKSSLLNRLVQEERVIVTEIPGTTRDVIEETLSIHGLPVRLSDTAGLRQARDRVEELGIQRTQERLARADLIIYLIDVSQPLDPEDEGQLAALAGRSLLLVLNKCDLVPALTVAELRNRWTFPIYTISALTGQGLAALTEAIFQTAMGNGLNLNGEIVTQARHRQILADCLRFLDQGQTILETGQPLELLALDLQEAVRKLAEILGEEIGEEVLDRIFAQFCLGK